MPIQIADMVARLNSESYSGEKKDGFADGQGIYRFSNGIVYSGTLKEGTFDGEGTMAFPLGGKFTAKWKEGKLVNGTYFYHDELEYCTQNWNYCTDADRRFWTGVQHGIRLEDKPQLTDKSPALWIPAGTYDIGTGYYDPLDNMLYHYSGKTDRVPTQDEIDWAVRKCRIGTADDDDDDDEEEEDEYETDSEASEWEEVTDDEESELAGDDPRPDSGVRRVTVPLIDGIMETAVENQMTERTFIKHVVDSAIDNAIGGEHGSRPATSASEIAENLVDGLIDELVGQDDVDKDHALELVNEIFTEMGLEVPFNATGFVDDLVDEAVSNSKGASSVTGYIDDVVDEAVSEQRPESAELGSQSRPLSAAVSLVDGVLSDITGGLI